MGVAMISVPAVLVTIGVFGPSSLITSGFLVPARPANVSAPSALAR
jgi:hypothetical protein